MGKMNWLFEVQLVAVVKSVFQVKTDDKSLIYFKNLQAPGNDYVLSSSLLSESEALEVAKMLAEVYANTSEGHYRSVWETERVQYLNHNSEASYAFLKTVLSLRGSSMHKLLLLASGASLVTDKNIDLMIALAQAKHETRFYKIDITDRRVYTFLQKVYFFPGVDKRTSTTNAIPEHGAEREFIEFLTRLAAFIANDSQGFTLKQHLELDFTKAIATIKPLEDITLLDGIPKVLFSDYRDIAESMTARELIALNQILTLQAIFGNFSKPMLQSRSKAIAAQDEDQRSEYGLQYIVRYLSKSELESLSSPSVARDLNALITSRDFQARTQPVVYAALAEVLSVKGERKAFEVAKTLEHLKSSKGRNLRMYEATAGIILEALEPENDDYPFGWVAQMSEHAWVLRCHVPLKTDFELRA